MPTAPLSVDDQADPSGNVRRAVVVDDDVVTQTHFRDILEGMGIDAEVSLGHALGELLKTFDPDLILLDVRLGLSDAFTVIRSQIPAHFRGVISIMSGLGLEIVAEVMLFGEKQGLRIGAPALKPIAPADIHHLVEVANHLLARKSIVKADKGQEATKPSRDPVRLRQALDTGLLELWYQPKFDIGRERMVGAEALIRGRRRDGEIVSPYELLTGSTRDEMIELTDFILVAVVEHAEVLGTLGFGHALSINVPVSYLLQPDPARLLRAAATDPAWPGLLFELTEDEALNDVEELQTVATQLGLYSVKLSIDDFGAAYSSLARLRDLPFKELKLDRSFVRGCARDSTKRSICKSVLTLGAELGVVTVAEGVEDAADLEVVRGMGCDLVQGFLFAKPMPFADFLSFVRAEASPGRGGVLPNAPRDLLTPPLAPLPEAPDES